MMQARLLLVCLLASVTGTCTAAADQPVMNEVPRWDGGYGGQVFLEWRGSDQLQQGSTELPNPDDIRYEKRLTRFEGVYTWRKEIRVTLKVPYADQKRRVVGEDGTRSWQRNTGLDDVRLAFPLRKYTNARGYSGHIGIVPQVRFGGDDKGEFPITDGSTDPGMSVTFERETAGFKVRGDVTYWWEQEPGRGDEWSALIDFGYNFHDRGAIAWETRYIDEPGSYEWLAGGPTLFWNFNDVVLGRIEYNFPFWERVDGTGLTRGHSFRMGLGVVY